MKKKLLVMALVAVVTLTMSACGNQKKAPDASTPVESSMPTTTSTQAETPSGDKAEWTEAEGGMTYMDTASPFGEGGLKLQKDPNAKTIKFILTDAKGNETPEYYLFDLSNSTVERYRFVSQMGVGFYYTYDLTQDTIVKVQNDEKEDTTEKTKSSGRLEGAVEETKEKIELLKNYFSRKFGHEIEKEFE